jgi:acetyl-CoA synthetase
MRSCIGASFNGSLKMNSRHGKNADELLPAWVPLPECVEASNLAWLMQRVGVDSYEKLHAWSVRNREAFWKLVIERLGIRFERPFDRVADLSQGVAAPRWLTGARLNIVESCFTAPPESPAVIHQNEGEEIEVMSVGRLAELSDWVASSLSGRGFKPGDALAMVLPMTAESVAIYLGIIKAGCVVVGIADSFRPAEIARRLRIAKAVGVFTQDIIARGGKVFELYQNIVDAGAPPAVVLPARNQAGSLLRAEDRWWPDFLTACERFEVVTREPPDAINILFSSGTTGEPKAIPWTQTTPLKCAMDAHFHQDIHPGDVLVWPTNIGWMMGPWLIFASLLNGAALGLYNGAPTGRDFGLFVQNSRATMLGVVPSLVKAWRSTGCVEGLDWSAIKLFSSTGECSNRDDMRWLMAQGGWKPVIEYCGGTEIGGGYVTGTVALPCVPGEFNTPALGLDFVILDEAGCPAKSGELFIVPPSIGLSTTLLNQDHWQVYFAGTPAGPEGQTLRRHGDQVEKLACGGWRALGRADDTMNLGGIKIGSAEIERTLQSIPQVKEVAAVAVSPDGGPCQLVIYAICSKDQIPDKPALMVAMQNAIKRDLNPLFKIHDLVLVGALPRTASNKIMRRALRDQYLYTENA